MKHLLDHTKPAIAAFALLVTCLNAQPLEEGPPPQTSQELTLGFSFSPEGELKDGNGKVEIIQYDLSYQIHQGLTPRVQLLTGISSSLAELAYTDNPRLPDKLQNVGMTLGAMTDLSDFLGPGWNARALLLPGFASDSSDISGSDFNLRGMMSIGRAYGPAFSWDIGVAGNLHGDNTVLPVVGLKWQFVEDWTLQFGFPQTGISYQASPDLVLRAGARAQGGTYRINSQKDPALDDSWLEYTEIRLGLGFDYQWTENVVFSLTGGAVAYRKFEYLDKDDEVRGEPAGYLNMDLKVRF